MSAFPRIHRLAIALGCSFACVVLAGRGMAQTPDGPKFAGVMIPVPPQQAQPWTPPETKLSSEVVSAFTALFAAGLADPRGGDYREITVLTGDREPVKTHGWLLPDQGGAKFAVGWNGLVYPVVTVGDPANLQADTQQMLQKDREAFAQAAARNQVTEAERKKQIEQQGGTYTPITPFVPYVAQAEANAQSLSTETMAPVKAALLLRLGDADLAEAVWAQACADYGPTVAQKPYLALAADLAWALFDRAVAAHLSGDDHLSLASAQALVALQQAVETEAAALGLSRPVNGGNSHAPMPYLDFLAQLPDLIADEQIRLQEPPHTPVLSSDPPPQGAERVTGLIRDLELVSARQMGFPGGVNLLDDANVQALAQEGDGAVEPLIKCLEEDPRLTRSLQMFRPWCRTQRTILPVADAAFVALCAILHTSEFGTVPPEALATAESRKALGEKIRAYWQQNQGKSPWDVTFAVLADDHADPKQWLQAAYQLVQKSNEIPSPGSTFDRESYMTRPLAPGEVVGLSGESLRSRANPSVSDLLVKRLKALEEDARTQANGPGDQANSKYLPAVHLAQALGDWDGKAHLGELRDLTELLKSWFKPNSTGQDTMLRSIASLYEKRIDLGDTQASADYAAWVVTVPTRDPNALKNLVGVIWHHPKDPVMAGVVEKLFSAPDSAWSSAMQETDITVALVGVPTFRTVLVAGLQNKTPAKAIPPVMSGGNIGRRLCDIYASQLSRLNGAPPFDFNWPEEKRDAAAAADILFLAQYGDDFQYDPDLSREFAPFPDQAWIHFPKLDHPATPADVQAGRAIFSLPGSPRQVKLPALPLSAFWRKLAQPYGAVWQAEEVEVNGEWQRSYGFVGGGQIAQVPAAEIEFRFAPDWGWLVAPGFEGKVTGPGEIAFSRSMQITLPSVAVGDPVPISLKFRSVSGVDQALPAALTPPTADGKTLPPGVTLTLFFTKGNLTMGPGPNTSMPAWTEVAPKTPQAAPPASAPVPGGPPLGPGQEVTVTSVDLRDFFDISQPGTYRLHPSTVPKPANDNDGPMMMSDALFVVAEKGK